jgi:hypothetical protein
MSHSARILLLSSFLAGFGMLLVPRRFLRRGWEKIKALGRWLNEKKASHRGTVVVLIWIIALIPMLHLTDLVRHYAVEVPTLDDWEMAPLIVDAHSGHLKWADIFAQQEEARTVLPKLIFILSTANGHWDVRDQMMLSVVCCWLTVAGIFILLRRSGLGPAATAFSFWLAVLAIFTPAQYELWIFASGFPSFLPGLFLVAGLIVVGSPRLATGWKLVLCGLLATASSFSLPHGLLAWALMFPVLLICRPVSRWRFWLSLWLGFCALCAIAYFWDYRKPVYLPAFAPAASPIEYVRFVLAFLGGGLAYAWKAHPIKGAMMFGGAQILLLLVAFGDCLRRIRDRDFAAKVIPWFTLAAYSLGSALLAALGRIGYGATYALASRYVAFSVYLTVAVVVLLALIVQRITTSNLGSRSRLLAFGLSFALVAAYLVPYRVCASNTQFFLRALSAKDRLGRAAVLFSPAIDTSQVIMQTIYPNDARSVIQRADALDRLRLLRPRLLRANRISALPHETADGRSASGACESMGRDAQKQLSAKGWALLNAKRRPTDCVAVAYRATPNDDWMLCAISNAFAMRTEIVRRQQNLDQLWAGWSATFSDEAIPAGAEFSFWAVDADEPRLYQLKNEAAPTSR